MKFREQTGLSGTVGPFQENIACVSMQPVQQQNLLCNHNRLSLLKKKHTHKSTLFINLITIGKHFSYGQKKSPSQDLLTYRHMATRTEYASNQYRTLVTVEIVWEGWVLKPIPLYQMNIVSKLGLFWYKATRIEHPERIVYTAWNNNKISLLTITL